MKTRTKAAVIAYGIAGPTTRERCHRCKAKIETGEEFNGREPTASQRLNSPQAIYFYHVPKCPNKGAHEKA